MRRAAFLLALLVLAPLPAAATHDARLVYLLQAAGEAWAPGNLLRHDVGPFAAPEPVAFRVTYALYDNGRSAYDIELRGEVTRAVCAEDDHPTPIPDSASLDPPALEEAYWRGFRHVEDAPGFPGKSEAAFVYGALGSAGLVVLGGAMNYQGTCDGLDLHAGTDGRGIDLAFRGVHGALAGPCGPRCDPAARVPGLGFAFRAELRNFTFYQERWP